MKRGDRVVIAVDGKQLEGRYVNPVAGHFHLVQLFGPGRDTPSDDGFRTITTEAIVESAPVYRP